MSVGNGGRTNRSLSPMDPSPLKRVRKFLMRRQTHKLALLKRRSPAEARPGCEKPHSGAINAKRLKKVSTKDWVMETVGLELGTHHPVFEPISASRRERDFRPQRQRRKCRLFAGGDYVRRPAGIQKAPIPARQCDKGEQSSSPGDCLVGAPGLEPGTR
jgi:hypothetical protein